jgi:hypothetical protein
MLLREQLVRQLKSQYFGTLELDSEKARRQQAGNRKGAAFLQPLDYLARPARFELATPWFVAKYSIQMSYGR